MGDDPSPGSGGMIDSRGLPIAALLRLVADGEELDAAGAARVESHLASHPEDRARIAFEQELRVAVGRTECGVSAPAALRERIELLASAARAQPGGLRLSGDGGTEEVASTGGGSHGGRGRQRFAPWARSWGIGLAATIVLGLSVLSIMRSAIRPADGNGAGPAIAAAGVLAETPFTARLASFVVGEHERCSHIEGVGRDAKFTAVDLREADTSLRSVFGRTPHMPDLESAGLEFVGAGRCGVPGDAPSMHLSFRVRDGSSSAVGEDVCCPCGGVVSLFVQEDVGQLGPETGFAPGRTYKLHSEGDHACCGCRTLVWSAEGFVYYLVADAGWLCNRMRACMGAPELAR